MVPRGEVLLLFGLGGKEGKDGDEEEEGEGEDGNGLGLGPGHHEEIGLLFEEGGDVEGLSLRREKGVPDSDAARRKHFLDAQKKAAWEWEEGRVYGVDFFNPYLDFNEFALRLPGFTMPIMKYWDGQGLRKEQKRSHALRYVLKNKATDEVLLVVLFTLYLKEDIDEEGNVKEGVVGGKQFNGTAKGFESSDEEDDDEEEVFEDARDDEDDKRRDTVPNGVETSLDDID
ncbi:hypothetical protein B7463_g9210, partial [Scytalidium lignicola]